MTGQDERATRAARKVRASDEPLPNAGKVPPSLRPSEEDVREDLERSAGEGMLPPPQAPPADRVRVNERDEEDDLPESERGTHPAGPRHHAHDKTGSR